MKKFAFAAALSLAATCLAGPAAAWDVIGQKNVRDRTDRDSIHLPGGRMFHRIKICVYRRPVHFLDVDIYYANGGHQDVSVAARINPGDCTRAIDFDGGARNIERIDFLYEETSFKRRSATVKVFAE